MEELKRYGVDIRGLTFEDKNGAFVFYTDYRDQLEAKEAEIAELRGLFGDALRAKDYAVLLAQEQKRTIKRIWEILGNPSYESLNGRDIFDMIEDLVTGRDEGMLRAVRLALRTAGLSDQAVACTEFEVMYRLSQMKEPT